MAERTFHIEVQETTPGADHPREVWLTVSAEEMTQQQPKSSWKPLKIGAGGWVTGLDISSDGSLMVCRTDTYGGYVWQDGAWQQFVSASTMPADATRSGGVFSIAIAKPDVVYMVWGDRLYRSGDGIWEATNVTFPMQDANSGVRMYGQKLAVDPNNPEVVAVGTTDGLHITRDGGETAIKTNVPASTNGVTGIIIAGHTITLCAGEHGVWRSTGNDEFQHIGGPINVRHAALGHDGHYLATDGNAFWRFDGSQWSSSTIGGVFGIAVDPHKPGHIVTCWDGGSLNESHDNGATWGGQNWAYRCQADDIAWLADPNAANPYMSVGRILFDPVTPNRLWMSMGIGVMYTDDVVNIPDWSKPVTWHSQSVGIEQLCANDILVPPGGPPALASWDRPLFLRDDLEAYPEGYLPPNSFSMGWSADYASSDPTFVCALVNYWGSALSGFTRDGTTWTPFPTQPPVNDAIGGSIAAITPDNIIVCPANKQPAVYTKDGGQTWQSVNLPGFPNWDSFHWAYYLQRRTVTADRVKSATAYIYAVAEGFAGVYETTDGGDTWTRVYDREITPLSVYNAKLLARPECAGELWFAAGATDQKPFQNMMRSTDGGRTWAPVPGILQPGSFGFGAPGEVATSAFDPDGQNFGIYRTRDDGATWENLGVPLGSLDNLGPVAADPNNPDRIYVGFGGSGFAYYG